MFSDAAAKKGVTFPKGFKAAGIKAGIKKSGNLDVAVICSEEEAAVAGVFTQNAVAAAPVYVSKAAVEDGKARAIVADTPDLASTTMLVMSTSRLLASGASARMLAVV